MVDQLTEEARLLCPRNIMLFASYKCARLFPVSVGMYRTSQRGDSCKSVVKRASGSFRRVVLPFATWKRNVVKWLILARLASMECRASPSFPSARARIEMPSERIFLSALAL